MMACAPLSRAVVLVASVWLWVAAGCRTPESSHVPTGTDPQQWAASLRAHLARFPKDDRARRDLAHVQWLHLGQAKPAGATLSRLAERGDVVARLSRLVMAQGQGDGAELERQAYALIEQAAGVDAQTAADTSHDPASALLAAAGEYAARALVAAHGVTAGADDRFVRWFDGLPRTGLNTGARREILSLRARIARAHGQPYAPWFEEQGCVQHWRVGPMEGVAAELELARERGPIVEDPEAEAVPLSCVVRLWNPSPAAGIRRMDTLLEVPGNELELELSAQEPMRVWLDGELIHRTDLLDRFAARRQRLTVEVTPGPHHLEVATVIPDVRSWVLVRATSPEGKAVTVRPATATIRPRVATPNPLAVHRVESFWARGFDGAKDPRFPAELTGAIYRPLLATLATLDAIEDGDQDRAELHAQKLAAMPVCGPCQVARASFEHFDPSRGATVSATREQQALQAALATDPTLDQARLRLFELMLARGDDKEVAQALRDLPRERLSGVHGLLLRTRVALSQGNEAAADELIARAAQLVPDNCDVLAAQRRRARDGDEVRREEALLAAMTHCDGNLGQRAALAQLRGHWEEAKTLWAQALQRVPDDPDILRQQAQVAMASGDRATAAMRVETMVRRNPFELAAWVAWADFLHADGDRQGALATLGRALALAPQSDALRQTGAVLGLQDDLAMLRVDGLAALADYRRAGGDPGGASEVLVLDRSVARVYPNGGQRHIVHLMVELRSKAAIDHYGELQLPEGARLLTLRTIKPDGRILEPESVPGKDGVSLRDLAVDDVVEQEFVLESAPATALPGYVDVSTFRFASFDVPYHRSELLVVTPPNMAIREDRRNDAPEAEVRTITLAGQPLQARLYRVRNMPRRGDEPGHRDLLDEVPNVRVYTALDLPAYLERMALPIRRSQRSNLELRAKVAELVRGHTTTLARLQALHAWVVQNIEEGGDASMPVTVTLAARNGNRLMLLRAMLTEAGIDSELWLARDRFGPPPLEGGHPMIERYDTPMLAVSIPEQTDPMMVMALSEVMPLGYLAPSHAKTTALRLPLADGDRAGGYVELPDCPASLADGRSWELEIGIDEAGAARVEGVVSLQGVEAVMWRQALREIDRDRIREVFAQAELGWLRGATLKQLDIVGEKQLFEPLVLEFLATAPDFGVRQGPTLQLPSSPVPMAGASRYATLATRLTGMVIPFAPQLRATIRVHWTKGVLKTSPADTTLQSPFGSYVRRIRTTGSDASALQIETTSSLNPGVVPPEQYAAFAAFARQAEAAEQVRVEVQLGQ